IDVSRVRKAGGGRNYVEDNIPNIQEKVREIVDGATYGNPEKVLSWTTGSLRKIQAALLEKHGINVSFKTVGAILEDMGYSKQANQKMLQAGKAHPDRNAQFEFIDKKAKEFIDAGEPVISVDTKKKENIGNFKNNGSEYRKNKDPRKVLDHDFPIEELGKIAPYGIYNLNHNTGFVNIGTSHDTAEFAVESISRWWEAVGKHTFPNAAKLLITCDCGGSKGNRVRLWKYQLAQFAERIGLEIHVSHFPPGTSKWNKIEHKLFCFISKNWQGKPLVDVQTAVSLIGSTTTATGLKVICQTDNAEYALSKKVADKEFDALPIIKIAPFESWNYTVKKA
ncbi:MAG: ISAzo13 family transposase, partial [Synergistaceae bacterium]|nr:ISAzo13 family transposase [Synergistaceae bacterium]